MNNDGAVDRIDHYGKDGNICILPESTVGMKQKRVKKKMPKNVNNSTKIASSQKTSMSFLKRFPTEMHSSCMYVRLSFRDGQFFGKSITLMLCLQILDSSRACTRI